MQNNNKKIIFAFWFIIIFSIQALLSFLYLHRIEFKVKGFSYPIEPITVNVVMEKPVNSGIFICFNDYCPSLEPDLFNKTYSIKYNDENSEFFKSKVKNIYLQNNQNKFIDSIFISVGNESYYFDKDEISKFEEKNVVMEYSGQKHNISLLKIPVKSNYKGIYNNLSNLFLSIFYNVYTHFPALYIWLFIAFLIWVYNKDKFNFRIKPVYFILLFMVIGALLRGSLLTYNPLWIDELYTKEIATKSFLSCFQDPGNPPLFYMIELFFTLIFGKSVIALRFLPYLISVLTIPLIYLFLKNINKNMAIFASFFLSVNIISIYHSIDARSYSLSMFLGILSAYCLFKYLKNPDNKNLIQYGICAICTLNTHYYLVFFIFTNFIWGMADLISNKNKVKNFIIINLISFISFIPYFLTVHSAALGDKFNLWIGAFNQNSFKYLINEYFINKYVFIFLCLIIAVNLIVIYLPSSIKNKLNITMDKEKENLFIYLIYSLAFIVIIISAVSMFIKPIFNKRIFMSIYFLLLLIEIVSISRIFVFEKISKIFNYIYSFVLILICFTITKPMNLSNVYRIDEFINLVAKDSVKYKDDYEINVITNFTDDYLNNFPNIKDKKYIKWHIIDTNSAQYLKKIKKSNYTNAKKAIIYTNAMCADVSSIAKFNPLANIYRTNSILLFRIKYEE